MEIRQIKHYLKRTGPEEFVIGENVLDPLVWVSGHNVIVDGVYTQYISGAEAWGWGGPSEFGFASSGNLFATGKDLYVLHKNLSGELFQTGQNLYALHKNLSGELFQTGQNLQNGILLLSGELNKTGENLQNYISLLSGELNATGQLLSARIDAIDPNVGTPDHDHEGYVTHQEAIAYSIIFG